MLRKPNHPTARSINLSSPDFLPLIGTEEGGRSDMLEKLELGLRAVATFVEHAFFNEFKV